MSNHVVDVSDPTSANPELCCIRDRAITIRNRAHDPDIGTAVSAIINDVETILSKSESVEVVEIRRKGVEFIRFIQANGGDSRETHMAIDRIEEAVMWAVKHHKKGGGNV